MKFKQIIQKNAEAIASLSDADLKTLIPVLEASRESQAAALKKWLSKVDGADKYTTATHVQLVSALDDSIRTMKKQLSPALRRDLAIEGNESGRAALESMRRVAIAGAKKFQGSAIPLKFDETKILLSKPLLARHESSALRYAGRQGDLIRKQLAVGLVTGASVDSVVSRLMGKPQIITKGMSDTQTADGIADNQFFKSRADAERLVRTENIHAANEAQMDALIQDNENAESGDEDSGDGEPPDEDDDSDSEGGGEGGWLLRWDAAFDKNTCEYCEDLDGEIRAPGEPFDDDCFHPPLHPYCRCAVTPWREGWEL